MHIRARTDSRGNATAYDYDLHIGTGGHGDTTQAYHTEISEAAEKFKIIYTRPIGAIDRRHMDQAYYVLLDLLKKYIPNYNMYTLLTLQLRNKSNDKVLGVNLDDKNMLCVSKIKGKIYSYFQNIDTNKIDKIN